MKVASDPYQAMNRNAPAPPAVEMISDLFVHPATALLLAINVSVAVYLRSREVTAGHASHVVLELGAGLLGSCPD